MLTVSFGPAPAALDGVCTREGDELRLRRGAPGAHHPDGSPAGVLARVPVKVPRTPADVPRVPPALPSPTRPTSRRQGVGEPHLTTVAFVTAGAGLLAGALGPGGTGGAVHGGLLGLLVALVAWLAVRVLVGARLADVDELQATVTAVRGYRAVVQASSDVVLLLTPEGEVRWVSPSLRTVLGRDPDAATGVPVQHLVHPDDQVAVRSYLVDLVTGAQPSPVLARVRHADGGWRHLETNGVDRLEDPTLASLVLTSRDVSERQALTEQLAHLALHDPLTGLPNRTLLGDRLETALAGAARSRALVAVLLLDLDGFKAVNDTLGHASGDELLQHVAGRLRDALRDGDTAARLGGDEFAVVACGLRTPEDGRRLAERLVAALRQPYLVRDAVVEVGASVGVALRPVHGTTACTLLRCADAAMYAAKRTGGGVAVAVAVDEGSPARQRPTGLPRPAASAEETARPRQTEMST